MSTKTVYWGATGLVAIEAAVRRVELPDRRSAGGGELPARGISPAVACLARHREAGRSHRVAAATAADVEGMGLRRLYLMWIAATVAHYLAGDGALFLLPVALIGVLALSYVMRPPTRRGCPRPRAERTPPIFLCNEEWDRAAAMIPRSGMALPLAIAGPREETPCRGLALEWSSTNW